MPLKMVPASEFDWTLVSWGGPDEPPAEDCSYCDAPIPDESVPLMIFNPEGWCARFCDKCQRLWWRVEKCE